MPVKSHVHKYTLKNLGTKTKPRKLYACALPDCTHFMPFMSHVIGKASICWQCNEEFILDAYLVRKRRVKPRCFKCRTIKTVEEAKDREKFDDAVDMLAKMRGL